MSIKFLDARGNNRSNQVPTGDQVKALRGKLNWTQEKLAQHMKQAGLPISQTEVSLIERGKESEPRKSGFKETHDRTKPKFLGLGYHSYRERLRLFFYARAFIL